ncbi:ribonuclease T2 family protein [Nostoc commune]|uniref:ribonuclease T2 family protein n=1 Tax=Nostoc commune TaxID=1178 RepID=UPI0018C80DE1|nr:hypothetical protein [Nostoc commune]MBG1262616.1 hypothetical protein [Nostoc commune BAE]
MQIKKLLIASSLLITSLFIPNAAIAQNRGTPGKFDFYVLTLSWSPDYCAANGSRDQQQCGSGRKLGFVLHGLWPQYQAGYPANCSTQKLPSEVRDFQIKKYSTTSCGVGVSPARIQRRARCPPHKIG